MTFRRPPRADIAAALLVILGNLCLGGAILGFGWWALPIVGVGALGVVALYRLEWAFYALIFLLPFTAIEGMAEGHNIVVQSFKRVLIAGILIIWVLHVLVAHRRVVLLGKLLWPTLVFSGAALAAVVRAPEPMTALSGTARLISYFAAYTLLTVDLLRTPDQVWRSVKIVLVSGALTAFFAMYQMAAHFTGLPTFLNPSYETVYAIPRVHSVMIEPLQLANFLLLIAPLALALCVWKQGKWPWLSFVTAAAASIGIAIAASRAGWGVFAVTLVIFTVIARSHLRAPRMLALGAVAVLVVTVAGVSVWSRGFGSTNKLASYLVGFMTFRDEETGEGDLRGRLQNLAIVSRALEITPIIGIGVNNVGFRFYESMTIGEPKISSSGNTYLTTFIETGSIGLGALVVLLWVGLRGAWRGVRRWPDRPEGALCFGLFMGTLAMSLHMNFTGSLSWSPHVFFAVGLCIAALRAFESDVSPPPSGRGMPSGLANGLPRESFS